MITIHWALFVYIIGFCCFGVGIAAGNEKYRSAAILFSMTFWPIIIVWFYVLRAYLYYADPPPDDHARRRGGP